MTNEQRERLGPGSTVEPGSTETPFGGGSAAARAAARGAADERDHVVAQLASAHRELDHLKVAMRHRAVIEQAKGVLIGWLGIDAEEAFGALVGYSQRTNRKLVHAAGALLEFAEQRGRQVVEGLELPSDLQLFAESAQERLDRRLDAAAIMAAPQLGGMLRELRESLPEPRPHALLVAAIEAGSAVRILASEGFDADLIAGWERIPPNTDVPVSYTAATGEPVFCDDRAERDERFPGSRSIPLGDGAIATLPVELGGLRLGVLALQWPDARRFTHQDIRALLAVAHDAAVPLADDLHGREVLAIALPDIMVEPGRARWFRATLDQLPVGVLLLEPVVDDGELVDATIVHANGRAAGHVRDETRLLGRRLSQLAPWIADSPLWRAFAQVWRDGAPVHLETVELVPGDGGRVLELEDVSVTRLSGLLIVGLGDVRVGPTDSSGG